MPTQGHLIGDTGEYLRSRNTKPRSPRTRNSSSCLPRVSLWGAGAVMRRSAHWLRFSHPVKRHSFLDK